MTTSPLLEFDKQQAIATDTNFVIGIDEAGRGPLAGPVVAAACFIPPALVHNFGDINDSKKLTASKREKIFQRLHQEEVVSGIGFASAQEIDQLNILQATFLAMRRAVEKLKNLPNAIVLVDGPYPVAQLHLFQRPIIDGDAKSLAIAAASVLAKVTRDHYMEQLDKIYPGYGFGMHKGYGTAAHLEALKKLGPCKEHRRTFGPVRRLLPHDDLFLP